VKADIECGDGAASWLAMHDDMMEEEAEEVMLMVLEAE